MIEVRLYGRLRRFAPDSDPAGRSIIIIPHREGDTVRAIVERIGIPEGELGSNLFVSGRYAVLETPVEDRDRIGLFPSDMSLLYKWYFEPKGSK